MCIKDKKIKKLYCCKFSTRSVLFKEKTKADFFSSHILFIFLKMFLERLVDKTVDLIKVQNTTPEKFSWVTGTLRLYFLNKSALN